MTLNQVITITLGALLSATASAQNIPLDTAVRTGRLANGLTYYIRQNGEPRKRVWMYLVNNVGSVLEDDDQQGLAHFMEHMNFNGTRHYPKNELEDYLQKAGVRFGADLNAYTSYDETVFELPIPTDDPGMVAKGLGIIRDWAQDALLDSTDIAEERGVVLEEERLGKGAADRMRREYLPVIQNHSRYSGRSPIGNHDILTGFGPEAIRRFHRDWYRPDLQAVIIVGDIDVDKMEQMIKTQFGDLKNPSNERPRTQYAISLTGEDHFVTVTDKEQPVVEVNILIKHKAPEEKTEQDYLASLKRELFDRMIAARYTELSQQPGIPFTQAGAGIEGFLGGLDLFAFSVRPKAGQFEQAFRMAWRVVEQVKRYGFTQTELDREKKNHMSGLRAALQEMGKTPSAEFVQQYQALFLKQEAAPGIDWEYQFTRDHIDGITPADINVVAREYLQDMNRDVLIMAPDKDKASLPDSARVAGWIQDIGRGQLTPYKDEALPGQLMPVKPVPGKVIKTDSLKSLGLTILTLSNGVTVVLKPTDFGNNDIDFAGVSPGGTSLSSDADYLSTANAGALINNMGIGNFAPATLSKLLNGRIAEAGSYIAGRSEGIQGSSTTGDLETALQLAYLRFTRPRIDTTLFNNMMSGARASLSNKYARPESVFGDTVSYILGGYNYRSKPVTVDRVDSIRLRVAYDFYRERFSDASGFTFVFVGNFNTDSIRPLLEMYLGSLPSSGKHDTARDVVTPVPPGIITKVVRKGSEDKATVELIWSGTYPHSPVNDFSLYALGEVLEIKLLQHLREAAAEVYSPSVRTSLTPYPDGRYRMTVSFGCAPANVDHLVSMVNQELLTLRDKGPEQVDLDKVKAAYQKQQEQLLRTNGFWLRYLSDKYLDHEDLSEVLKEKETVDQVTVTSLQADARQYLSGRNFIRLELLPETAAERR
jgi:zinc protease